MNVQPDLVLQMLENPHPLAATKGNTICWGYLPCANEMPSVTLQFTNLSVTSCESTAVLLLAKLCMITSVPKHHLSKIEKEQQIFIWLETLITCII